MFLLLIKFSNFSYKRWIYTLLHVINIESSQEKKTNASSLFNLLRSHKKVKHLVGQWIIKIMEIWLKVNHFVQILDEKEEQTQCITKNETIVLCTMRNWVFQNRVSIIQFLVSIVVSMPACHAGDQGSIPWRGGLIFALFHFIFGNTTTFCGHV